MREVLIIQGILYDEYYKSNHMQQW